MTSSHAIRPARPHKMRSDSSPSGYNAFASAIISRRTLESDSKNALTQPHSHSPTTSNSSSLWFRYFSKGPTPALSRSHRSTATSSVVTCRSIARTPVNQAPELLRLHVGRHLILGKSRDHLIAIGDVP